MSNGKFIDFMLPYIVGGQNVPSHDMGVKLLDEARTLIGNGSPGVGFLYSANYGQTRTIEKTYFAKEWNTKTTGAHQAVTVMAIEKLLGTTYSDLQGKVHITPISTMDAYDHPVGNWNDDLQRGIVTTDLDRIEYYLQCGWDILALQDQDSNAKKPYAVGGNIASMSQVISDLVQKRLIGFSSTYK